MIVGLIFTTGYIIYFQFITGSTDYLFGIKPSGIGFLGMLLNFLVAGIVSHCTAKPPEEVVEMVEEIRIPKGAGAAQDH
jgi:cation/acetate symporter